MMKLNKKYTHIAALAGIALATSSSQGALISVDSYVYDTTGGVGPNVGNAIPDDLEDGGTELTNGVISPAWNDVETVGFRNDTENGLPQPRVTFDLGGLYDVTLVDLFTPGFQNADDEVRIYSSPDGTIFSTPVVVDPIVWVGSGVPAGGFKVSVDVSSLPAGQFYRVEQFDNATQWMMLSEVQFDGTAAVTAVPEPSTTALLGLGGLALILRRRK